MQSCNQLQCMEVAYSLDIMCQHKFCKDHLREFHKNTKFQQSANQQFQNTGNLFYCPLCQNFKQLDNSEIDAIQILIQKAKMSEASYVMQEVTIFQEKLQEQQRNSDQPYEFQQNNPKNYQQNSFQNQFLYQQQKPSISQENQQKFIFTQPQNITANNNLSNNQIGYQFSNAQNFQQPNNQNCIVQEQQQNPQFMNQQNYFQPVQQQDQPISLRPQQQNFVQYNLQNSSLNQQFPSYNSQNIQNQNYQPSSQQQTYNYPIQIQENQSVHQDNIQSNQNEGKIYPIQVQNLQVQQKQTLQQPSQMQANTQYQVAQTPLPQNFDQQSQQNKLQAEQIANPDQQNIKSQILNKVQNIQQQRQLQTSSTQCLSCYQNNQLLTLSCRHQFCKICLVDYINKQTDGRFISIEGEKGYQVTCMKCVQVLKFNEIEQIIGKQKYEQAISRLNQQFNQLNKPKSQIQEKQEYSCFNCQNKQKSELCVLICNHMICKKCFLDYIQQETEGRLVSIEGEKGYKLKCFLSKFDGCRYELSEQEIIEVIGKEKYEDSALKATERIRQQENKPEKLQQQNYKNLETCCNCQNNRPDLMYKFECLCAQ